MPLDLAVGVLPANHGHVHARRARWFVAATITYNVLEAFVALTEGVRVSSSALIGFGLDSVIEVSSAAAVAWQFADRDPETREKVALRIIAFSYPWLTTPVIGRRDAAKVCRTWSCAARARGSSKALRHRAYGYGRLVVVL